MKKIFWRVFIYFGVVLIAFTLFVGLLFTRFNRTNIISAYKKQLSNLADNVVMQTKNAVQEEAVDDFHNYLSTIESYSNSQEVDVWIVSHLEGKEPLSDEYTNVDIETVDLPEETKKILESAYSGKKKSYYSEYDDIYKTMMLHLAVPVRNSRGYVMGAVIVTGPMKMQENIITQYEKYMIFCSMAGLLVTLLLALYFSRQIARPIVRIKDSALVLSSGQYGGKTGIHREDEIGSLAASMDVLSERLVEAKEMQEGMEQTRSDFFSNVSHELRTPIAVVKGYADALAEGCVNEPEKQQEYILRIRNECGSMERLVSDLLVLSRMQNPDYELNMETINVIAVAQDVMRSMRILMKERGMGGTVEYSDACSMIRGDYDRIRQLFVILMQNAVKYADEGSAVQVDIERKEGKIWATVCDFGNVIPEEEKDLIFEKFYRASNHGEKDGSGLGLVVAKNIVERHGGEISVLSSETEGTRFIVKFPEVPDAMLGE